ncbi:MAG: polysaccharide deacetylase family protein [Ignavibacteriaceae bacterium]
MNCQITVSFLSKSTLVNSILLIFFFTIFSSMITAQDNTEWHNKKCAVCLTYDDGLKTQLDNAVPLLDSLGLKATFYVPGFFPGFRENLEEWRSAAQKGNELGNHTLFHPCQGKAMGRGWVKPDYDLSNYSVQRMADEIEMENVLLQAVDGRTKRTFAYPCGDIEAGNKSYVSKIEKDFAGARGVRGKMQKINEINLFDIGCYMINGETGDSLICLVKKAMSKNGLLVFLFHGVGGGHDINVSIEAHSKLLHFLKQNEKEIWIAPLVDIAEYLKEFQQKNR